MFVVVRVSFVPFFPLENGFAGALPQENKMREKFRQEC